MLDLKHSANSLSRSPLLCWMIVSLSVIREWGDLADKSDAGTAEDIASDQQPLVRLRTWSVALEISCFH